MHSKTDILLLAAGKGTRLKPFTDHFPKCLIPVDGRPLLDTWMLKAYLGGIEKIYINTHWKRQQVLNYINWANRELYKSVGTHITELYESDLLGSLKTFLVKPRSEYSIVACADTLNDMDLTDLVNDHILSGAGITVCTYTCDDPTECGIFTSKNGRITKFEEKPKTPESNLANAGIYVISDSIYNKLSSISGSDFGNDALPKLLHVMNLYHLDKHIDIGTGDHCKINAKVHKLPHTKKAIFIDRDDTLIRDLPKYNGSISLHNSYDALRKLRADGYELYVITNQARVHSDEITINDVHAVNKALNVELVRNGVFINGFYISTGPRSGDFFRKPSHGLLIQAAIDTGVDLSRSWMIGDKKTDVEAGLAAGCKTILYGQKRADYVSAKTWDDVVKIIL